jgi:energy-coupling factor transporter ATP-binding protein EcfA2
MKVYSIKAINFGPFALLEEVKLGSLATIVGKNDAGKSNILRALQFFFEKQKIEIADIHNGASDTENVVLEVALSSLPETFEIETSIKTSFIEERLVDRNGHLRIRKTYQRDSLPKYSIQLIIQDYADDRYAELCNLKEGELNARCEANQIDVTNSGRGITNKSKREALRRKADEEGVQFIEREFSITTKDDLWKIIVSLMPSYVLFETDTKLGVDETTFQSQFRPIVKTATEDPDVVDTKNAFTQAIGNALQGEVNKIFTHLQRHTDVFNELTVNPEFSWDKAVSFDILGKDQYGIKNSLGRRGSGFQRLFMVAFFEYLAGREKSGNEDFIFAIEEPENCLHPGLQRELVKSFRKLADEGYQVIITSHSPVFAGASPTEDLALIIRESGVARGIQVPNLDLASVAAQLGVEPSDQITGYHACIFVEGPSDIEFWKCIAEKLKGAGYIPENFDDRHIGFVICGGDTLKYWIDQRAMQRLNRHFGAVVDSDRASPQHNIPGRKLYWKKICEEQGGIFFILRKREIENYLHPNVFKRSNLPLKDYDDYSDMKNLFGENVFKLINSMTVEEVLNRDCYLDNSEEHHELGEIVEKLLSLSTT